MGWIENEYGSMNIGDERLDKREKKLLKRFSDKPMESIPASCKGWSETKALTWPKSLVHNKMRMFQ